MVRNNKNHNLVNKILQTISKLTFLDRKKVINFQDIKLYPSEIHLLLFLHDGPQTNITNIADHIGITKGAISQTLSRLERKGIISKQNEPSNYNQLNIQFTDKGNLALKKIFIFRDSLRKEYQDYISSL
ncbi:MAG: MarR family transcriptional regulator [Candidatus Lokiarchaeota archaeon]